MTAELPKETVPGIQRRARAIITATLHGCLHEDGDSIDHGTDVLHEAIEDRVVPAVAQALAVEAVTVIGLLATAWGMDPEQWWSTYCTALSTDA